MSVMKRARTPACAAEAASARRRLALRRDRFNIETVRRSGVCGEIARFAGKAMSWERGRLGRMLE
jgi:hypothetical protein